MLSFQSDCPSIRIHVCFLGTPSSLNGKEDQQLCSFVTWLPRATTSSFSPSSNPCSATWHLTIDHQLSTIMEQWIMTAANTQKAATKTLNSADLALKQVVSTWNWDVCPVGPETSRGFYVYSSCLCLLVTALSLTTTAGSDKLKEFARVGLFSTAITKFNWVNCWKHNILQQNCVLFGLIDIFARRILCMELSPHVKYNSRYHFICY